MEIKLESNSPIKEQFNQPPKKSKFLKVISFYLFLFFILLGTSWFVWREFFYIYSLRATVMGNIIQFKSPEQGWISKIYVKDGDYVKKGDILYELDISSHLVRISHLEQTKKKIENHIDVTKQSIKEEQSRIAVFIQANEGRLQLLESELAGLKGKLGASFNVYRRLAGLLRLNAVSQQEVDIVFGLYQVVVAEVNAKENEIQLQKYLIAEAKNGRFITGHNRNFAGFNIEGDLPSLKENVAKLQTDLSQVEMLISNEKEYVKQAKVVATISGKINHLHRLEGDYVDDNEYVLSIQDNSIEPYIAARFTSDDAKYLRNNEKCQVVLLSYGKTVPGKIMAIGHSGLNESGAVSVDLESALAETPVKIRVEDPKVLKSGEGVFVKVKRNWSVHSWLHRLY